MGIKVKFMGVLKPMNYKDSQGLVVEFLKKYMTCAPHLGSSETSSTGSRPSSFINEEIEVY